MALYPDYRTESADFRARCLHRGMAVRLHAELHDAARPVAGDRRADR